MTTAAVAAVAAVIVEVAGVFAVAVARGACIEPPIVIGAGVGVGDFVCGADAGLGNDDGYCWR